MEKNIAWLKQGKKRKAKERGKKDSTERVRGKIKKRAVCMLSRKGEKNWELRVGLGGRGKPCRDTSEEIQSFE